MRAYERFLTYAAIRTPSDENSTTSPSSKCQFELADLLKDEMLAIGIADAHVTEYLSLIHI